jgi:glycosyltransferase 2 family protein
MKNKPSELDNLTDDQKKVLASISPKKMILPITIGLSVVAFLLWKQYKPEVFANIHWTTETFFWIALAFILLVMRHLAFSLRMYILSQGHFSFSKCIELIFIFEFSLCITPTTLGGSAVSLFVMTQEKLSAARTTTIVLYKVVLDTIFFIGTIPILFSICGPAMIRPGMQSLTDMDWRSRIFYLSYGVMATYGCFLFYGLFINPTLIKKFLVWMTKLPLLNRLNERAIKLGDEIILASGEMKHMGWGQHFAAFACTLTAWTCKFFLISCLIYGIVHPVLGVERETLLYARLQSMFVIMAFSPSPGGAGFAEFVFGDFLSDFVPAGGIALVVAFIWRLMTYYAYLAAGAFIIPNWIRKVFIQNKLNKHESV